MKENQNPNLPNFQCEETLPDPNVPPVGDTIDALLAAAHRISAFRNGTEFVQQDLHTRSPTQPLPQPENVSLLLGWLQWAFDHLEPPDHEE